MGTWNAIGIDVSSRTLTVAGRHADGSTVVWDMKNTKADLLSLSSRLKQSAFTGRIVMESTGRYHLLCAIMLHEHGLDVYVVNPLAAKKYANGTLRRNKTDHIDAVQLSEMAQKEECLGFPFTLTREDVVLRTQVGLLDALESQLQQARASLKQYQMVCATLEQLDAGEHIHRMQEVIKQMQEAQRSLEQRIEGHLDRDQTSEITAIKGISPFLVALLMIYCSMDCVSSKQWIAYLGLDVGQRQSGQWKGRGRLTKKGNSYLRKRSFSAAWGMMMHSDECKAYYNHLRRQGRSYKEALIIIARKIISIIFTMLKTHAPFDPAKTFTFSPSFP